MIDINLENTLFLNREEEAKILYNEKTLLKR